MLHVAVLTYNRARFRGSGERIQIFYAGEESF